MFCRMEYQDLIRKSEQTEFIGWDFGVFAGGLTEGDTSWDYRELVTPHLAGAHRLLDMGTGGGELLSSMAPLPAATVATESYPPNVPVAWDRLRPLGVTVVRVDEEEDVPLPFRDNAFSLIINRHESFAGAEIARILEPGGLFITQQVGGGDLAELNEALAADTHGYTEFSLASAVADLAGAGLDVVDQREEFVEGGFRDIGAVALFLHITPWQIPGYTREGYDDRLRALHETITSQGPLRVRHHRFLVMARLPG